MNILHIHPSLNTGGIETMIFNLANEMIKKHNVSICSIFKPSQDTYYWNALSSDIQKIDLGKEKGGFSIKEIWRIYRFIAKGNFDIVNIHGFFVYYILAVLLLHKRVKFFYTFHSDANKENSRWDRRFFWLKKYTLNRGWIKPITISNESQESFSKLYNLPSYLIPNGIAAPVLTHTHREHLNQYRLTNKTILFIHIGRIDTPKNQVVLCKSVQHLIENDLDVVLLIAGPIANKQIFEDLKPFFNSRIHYIGEITNACEYLAYCDAMLLPSIWEGLPVTLLESISVGCIPICSPVGGIVNVLTDEINGLLSKSSNLDDYSQALERYMSFSPQKLNELKRNAISSFYKSYVISNTAAKYIEAYCNC